jgi:hypothetical protein
MARRPTRLHANTKKFKVGFVRKKGDFEWKKVEGWLVWKAHSYGRLTRMEGSLVWKAYSRAT